MDQPGKVADPARGQLNRENDNISLSSLAPENLVSRDGFGRPAPRQPAHLHTLLTEQPAEIASKYLLRRCVESPPMDTPGKTEPTP